jgi:hypothetical protein
VSTSILRRTAQIANAAEAAVEPLCGNEYHKEMLRPLGKLMQIAALLLLPVSMLMEITTGMRAEAANVDVMLLLLLLGIALFWIGRIVEGYAAK